MEITKIDGKKRRLENNQNIVQRCDYVPLPCCSSVSGYQNNLFLSAAGDGGMAQDRSKS